MLPLLGSFCRGFQLSLCKWSASHKSSLLTEEWGTIYFAFFLIVLKALSCDWSAESCSGVTPFLRYLCCLLQVVSVVVGRGKTIVNGSSSSKSFASLQNTRDGTGKHYVVVKDQWKKRHWHRGLWRAWKDKDEADEENSGALVRREEWDEESATSKLFHRKQQATALSQGGQDHKDCCSSIKSRCCWPEKIFGLVTRYFKESLKL